MKKAVHLTEITSGESMGIGTLEVDENNNVYDPAGNRSGYLSEGYSVLYDNLGNPIAGADPL